ncbi:unnamed protein product [Medioppia subpectinata]|uniref:Uncharacterized protein n=1 Tax=Medioppia subpectinata TaxID=1979941 RepID=A0A7R9LIE8_9ACAR|nr:unnamed protein product [Medioppia subpectinata]CAG2118510.1 unnamed protein product [Medioppia subpectinata]
MDSMETMSNGNNDLRPQLSSNASFVSNQEVVTDLSELSTKNSALSEKMSALEARNESEVKTLKAELKSAMDSMETMVTENNNLKQTVYSLSQMISYNISNQNMATDLKHKLSEMTTKNTELNEELSALKASKHIIESDVKQLAQEINDLNIRHSVSDSSSSCSSIGSHNQLTTNSDKTRDQINVCQSARIRAIMSARLSHSRESLPKIFK